MQKFIIKQQVGVGSFGEVFLAYDKKNNKNLAIKRIKTHFKNQQEVKDLIQVKILSKLRHPNIIELKEVIYDKSSQKGSIVFQYCYSDILSKLCHNRKQRAPQIQIKKCIYEIVSALSFIHSKNYIHRDLKPQNILLQQNQFQGKVIDVVKLCDFGISKRSDDLPLTEYIGTRWYRAPELLIKMKNYTKAVDIFSLGCIMAEIYNLKILFHGKNANQQLLLIMKKLGTPTKQTWPQFSNWCQLKGIYFGKYQKSQDSILNKLKSEDLAEDLVEKMLIMNPKNRITAQQILKHPYFNQVKPQMMARQYAAQPIKINEKDFQQQAKKSQQKIQLGQEDKNEKQKQIKTQQLNSNRLIESSDKQSNSNKKALIPQIKIQQIEANKQDKKVTQKSQISSITAGNDPVNNGKLLKKPPQPVYYSPYSSTLAKGSSGTVSSKQFNYFQTYVADKQNQDRIRTTYELHKEQESRNSSFKSSNYKK